MQFEWSERKNQENIRKHFLDLSDTWQMFHSPMLVVADKREDYGENRFVGIGFLRDLIVVAVFTESGSDIIRVVSLRRAVKHEREKFIKYLQNELGTTEDDVR